MSDLNTFPIEDFLNKARLAIKTGQKNITFSIKEVTDLSNLNLKLEIKVSTLENKITELNKTISTSDGTLAVEKALQLENDNKLLQAKLDIANKNLSNVNINKLYNSISKIIEQ